MPRVTHFEINSENTKEAIRFYSEVFGWTISKKMSGEEDYWLIHTGRSDERGINGGIKKKVTREPGLAIHVDVDNIDSTLKRVAAMGGKVTLPKTPLAGTGYLAYCEDPEGISFCILQKDPSAK